MKITALQALAKGLLDGGCEYATNYPGFESHTLFDLLGGKTISINEKVAYEMAYGGSLAGVRSVVSMKSIGMNVCADSFLSSLLSGVNAGLVLVVTDDMQVLGSQARQDSRHYLDIFGGLWFEPNSVQSAYDAGYSAFTLSERFDLPIVIRLTNQFFTEEAPEIISKNKDTKKFEIANDPGKFIVHPVYWKQQQKSLNDRNVQVEKYLTDFYQKQLSNKFNTGLVSVGCNKLETSKYEQQDVDLLEVTAYPLPKSIIKRFSENRSNLIIVEQGDDYIKQKFLLATSKIEQNIESDTGFIPDIEYRNWSKLETFFKALESIKPSYVVSDITQFTVETTSVVDSSLCLGAAVSTAIGLCETGVEYPYVIVGDVSFLHGGLISLYEAIARKVKFGLVIIDNGGSWCTGLQPGTTSIYDLNLVPDKIINYVSEDEDSFASELKNMRDKNELSILYVKIPND